MGKRGPAKTTGSGKAIVVRCHEGFLEKLDAWRRKQADLPSRPAALRRLAGEALGAAVAAPAKKR